MRISLPTPIFEYIAAIMQLDPSVRSWVLREAWRRFHLKKRHYCQSVLLSYPRSGNHLVRYLLESAFQAPSLGASDSEYYIFPRGIRDFPLFVRLPDINVINRTPIAVKRHLLKESDNFDKLVLLVRDPVEAILSHLRKETEENFNSRSEGEVTRYVSVLKSWRLFSPEARFLVEFESVISESRDQVHSLAMFLGAEAADFTRLEVAIANRELAINALPRPASTNRQTYAEQFPSRARRVRKLLSGSEQLFEEVGYRPPSLS